MSAKTLVGVLLVVVGIIGLAYGRISFTKETHEADLGPIQLSVKEKETVAVPIWAGIAVIALGSVVLLKREA